MNQMRLKSSALILTAGALAGIVLTVLWMHAGPVHAQADDTNEKKAPDAAMLQAEIELMKGKLPGQAHAMMDVGYHYTNLWFAAQRGNWPLAEFYFNETRSHLKWAVRIIPIRKDNQGKEVKLADILQSLENNPLKQLEASIKEKDREKFVAAYQFTMTGCYSCHKAADKPYLNLRIPDHPAESIIDYGPLAAPFSGSAPKGEQTK